MEYGKAVLVSHSTTQTPEIERAVLEDWSRESLLHPEYGLKEPEILRGIRTDGGWAWGWYEEVSFKEESDDVPNG